MIQIDKREKDPELLDLIVSTAEEYKYEWEFATLSVGDFLWPDVSICVEHKTTEDFLQSFISGHLYSQLRDMMQYRYGYLFIEGQWPYKMNIGKARLTQKMVAGMLSTVMYHFPSIQVFYWPTQTMFAQAVVSLRNRADEKGPLVDIVKRIPSKTIYEDPNLAAFMSVPGIGEKKAREYIATYGTFWVFIDMFKNDPEVFRVKGCRIPKKSFAYMEAITR